MTTMAKTATRSVDLEPIDRLEEKMRLLVSMVERMKAEQARAAEENQRLARELESMRARLAANDSLASELSSMKEERDVIRTRVTDMLEQLEALSLWTCPASTAGPRACTTAIEQKRRRWLTKRSSRSRSAGSAIQSAARWSLSTWRGWRATWTT